MDFCFIIMENKILVPTLDLFAVLDRKLIELLKSLTVAEWNTQTVAKLWKVKDVAAHLLDGNLRGLSITRDGYFGESADNISSYGDLVSFLNNLNMTWTNAARRLSPQVLIELLDTTGGQYTSYLQTLDPFEDALLSVAWAGQERSANWFHIAREYTEKFLHQQQIRDAVGKPGIMTRDLYYPFIDILMYALPFTFHKEEAVTGTTVSLIITTPIGGQWNIVKSAANWVLNKESVDHADATVLIDPDTAWKLFSKSWTPDAVIDKVQIGGDEKLAHRVLHMVSVMA